MKCTGREGLTLGSLSVLRCRIYGNTPFYTRKGDTFFSFLTVISDFLLVTWYILKSNIKPSFNQTPASSGFLSYLSTGLSVIFIPQWKRADFQSLLGTYWQGPDLTFLGHHWCLIFEYLKCMYVTWCKKAKFTTENIPFSIFFPFFLLHLHIAAQK